MAQPVVVGDMLACTFGAAPAPIALLPTNRVNAEKKPMANVMDHQPSVNIPSFGVCTSLANPATAALTLAALGVLTPGPCAPATTAPWIPGVPSVMVGKMPALNSTSKCMCTYGGVISVSLPTAMTETVP